MARSLRILALEPWLGGSHRLFLEQWAARSNHRVEILGLPPRTWRWRMRAGAWQLAKRLREEDRDPPDLLFASDYLDLPAFYGELPSTWSHLPGLLYFHENQLTYPTLEGEVDRHLAYTNIASAVRASALVFNSAFHRQEFSQAARAFLRILPKPNPLAELEQKLAAAEVVYPGVDHAGIGLGRGGAGKLRVVFNQRWEHDKDPRAMLAAVREAIAKGAEVELLLCGETYEKTPEGVAALLAELAPHTLQRGYAADRGEYVERLRTADVVLSTALHEFYGIAVLEAIAAGCHPLLPQRLSYPELIPEPLKERCLYARAEELPERLLQLAAAPDDLRLPGQRAGWRDAVLPHDLGRSAEQLDAICRDLVG